MNEILDQTWAYVEFFLNQTVQILEKAIFPLEVFGPGSVIFLAALAVMLFTRFASRVYVTKRYLMLKKQFQHWQNVREQALTHPDPHKAKALARNIDQAELNRAYYDYFFEGMLKNLVTTILPILLTAAFISKIYTPTGLMQKFGDKWVFSLSMGKTMINASSLFWFVISLMICFALYATIKGIMIKKRNHKTELAQSNI